MCQSVQQGWTGERGGATQAAGREQAGEWGGEKVSA